jgi:lipoprotein-anchoring transpeptidase ErfK/SrfK/alkylhydroperoxidase/carboxymuconolactone decarboxylase family protein YurZ
MGVVLATFALVVGFTFVQQMREASAEQDFQSARAEMMAAQAHAADLGLESAELSDLQRQELTTASENPPQASAPFNEDRIAFFSRAASQEVQIKEQLQTRVQKLLTETHDSAQAAVHQLSSSLQKAKQVGVDQELLVEFAGLPSRAQIQVDSAGDVRAYRAVSNELKTRMSKLALLIADQETANKLIDQYASKIAADDHGDPDLARAAANAALAQVQGNMATARIFSMDVSIIDANVQKLVGRLNSAPNAPTLEQVGGGLMVQDKVLRDAMTQTLPEKAITISLTEQVIRAYEHGQQVFWSYTTTGRPGLETDPGSFKVYWKVSPWTMHSPWPKGSAYWYPDSKVQMVMWFNGGDGIHDASWRSRYGPGTNGPHYDPTGEDTGTHGCVNVPYSNMVWLWDWTPTGTPVIVY